MQLYQNTGMCLKIWMEDVMNDEHMGDKEILDW